MGTKNKILTTLSVLLFISLTLNIYLIKHKIEVNIIGEVKEEKSVRKIFKSNAVSFNDNFENGTTSGWNGNIRKDVTYQGSKFSLEAPRSNGTFSCGTTKNLSPKNLRVQENTKIEFAYYIEEGSLIHIQCYSPSKKDNFGIDIDGPVLGKWTRVSLDLRDFRDNASKSQGVEIRDSFSNIQIYGGRAGEDTLLLIDDFVISEK